MENPPLVNLKNTNEQFLSKEQLKEYYFKEVVTGKLLDSFEHELTKFGFNEEQIHEFRVAVLDLSEAERDTLFAFPWSLKQKTLPYMLSKIEKGEESVSAMVAKILDASSKQHRSIAYHCTDENIMQKDVKLPGEISKEWVINGKEADHRDDDLPMAYYSFDYNHLYREKNPKFIYLVSVQLNDTSGHKRDENGSWGRAPSLSVIEKIDVHQADSLVNDLVKQRIEEGDNKKAATREAA